MSSRADIKINWWKLKLILLFIQFLCPYNFARASDGEVKVVHTTEQVRSSSARGKTVLILGVSWHSGFCETRSSLPECRSQNPQQVDARQFSLHGLWQMRKSYCGVPDALKSQDKARKWLAMPELTLDPDLKVELATAMPGALSGLDRHEWIKHGTCSGDVASGYYSKALRLLAALNSSDVQSLFQRNLGKELDATDIQAAFESAFGPGAGERIKLRCAKDGSRQVITGLTIGLGNVEGAGDDLEALIAAAGTTKVGCARGVVDEAGLQ
jgi:ribonuclease T2